MAEMPPETLEDIVRRVLSEQKKHGHRAWGVMDQRTLLTFQHQTDVILNQAPVAGTWYTILNTTSNVRIISIGLQATWTVQPSLELRITIDGVVFVFSIAAPVTATPYYPSLAPLLGLTFQPLSITDNFLQRAFFLEGRSVKVECRVVGGTSSNLYAIMRYARRT